MNPVAITLLAIGACFDIFCIVDLIRANAVRGLPKWLWVLVILIQCPLGGILYLWFGRVRRQSGTSTQ
jgi:hypothetical protein